MRKIILVLSLLSFCFTTLAQTHNSVKYQIELNKSYSNLSWSQFVKKVEDNYPVHFFYRTSDFPEITINIESDKIPLKTVLTDHLLQFNIFVSIDQDGNIFLTKNTSINTQLPLGFFKERSTEVEKENVEQLDANYIKTTAKFVTENAIVGTKEDGVNKRYATIKGIATNSVTGEKVVGATILDLITKKGVVTDESGQYSITLNKGKHVFKISSVNIVEKQIDVDLRSSGNLDLVLDDKIILLKDVIVSADKDNKLVGTQMGLDKLIAKNVKKIPLVFGEKDVVKIALLLPGVQSVGEGSAGFNVRGSPTDQNLFYINHVPIYNTSHASGFFSAFNADIVDEFSLFKSNIPIEYGGRLSSVFEIKSKDGSKEKVTAHGGIGPITGRISVEGPLKKDKSSFLIGARSTYSNWILNFVKDPIVKNSKVQFSDVVTNFSFQLNEKNKLNLFTYFSNDKMDIYTQSKYGYQNYGASTTWKHFFENQNSFEISLVQSGYKFNEENKQMEVSAYSHQNELTHAELKAIVNIVPFKNHNVKFGLNSTLYNINKGVYSPLTDLSLIKFTDLGKEKGIESGLFLSDDWKVNPKLTLSGGFRYNLYSYLGPQDVNRYRDGLPYTNDNIVEVLHFSNWQSVKTYNGLDFRFAVNHLINDNLSVKAAYNRLHQYIYMLSNTIAVSPNYRWKLSDYNTNPIVGDQIALGFYSNLFQKHYELSVETYYKFSQNVVEIKDGQNLFFNENLEQSSLQGNLSAYGMEVMLKKNTGKLTGWINYTYSNSKIRVDSPFAENRINYGDPYPSNYDKPHAFNLVSNFDFSRRIALSGNVVYSTGRPITYPTSIYYYRGIPTLSYSSRNAYRIPDYFRVDLSITMEGNLLKRKLGHGTWAFSVYNVLGRKNAYSVYFEEKDGLIKSYKLSIFGAPIISISYNFKLGNYASE